MMEHASWLRDNEINRIPLFAAVILDDLIRENRPVVFAQDEGVIIDESGVSFWNIYIKDIPTSWGLGANSLKLYSSQYEANYVEFKDQIIRYLRWLKNEVYPHYQVRNYGD